MDYEYSPRLLRSSDLIPLPIGLGEVTCISPDRGRSGAARAKREGFPHATSLYFKKRPGPKLEGMPSHLKVQSQAKERILTDDRRKHTKRYEARGT
jgi:hypothetical protein